MGLGLWNDLYKKPCRRFQPLFQYWIANGSCRVGAYNNFLFHIRNDLHCIYTLAIMGCYWISCCICSCDFIYSLFICVANLSTEQASLYASVNPMVAVLL